MQNYFITHNADARSFYAKKHILSFIFLDLFSVPSTIASLMATSGVLSVSNMSLNACFNSIWPQVMLEVITSIFLNVFAVGPLTAKKNANATIKDLPRELHNIGIARPTTYPIVIYVKTSCIGILLSRSRRNNEATYVSNLAKVDLRLGLSPSPSSSTSPSPSSCVCVSSPDSFDISITASLLDSSYSDSLRLEGKLQGTLIKGMISIQEIGFVSEPLAYGQTDTKIKFSKCPQIQDPFGCTP
uniref:Uncharacterized protein n=1 Tax=Glossina pallidipes TaxID=7398 RepID=A0A1B0AET3_GLOPL